MIPFNIPPYVGEEENYIKEAIGAGKICGGGQKNHGAGGETGR